MQASALVAVVGYFAAQVPLAVRLVSNKGLVVLLNQDHGITFVSGRERTGSKLLQTVTAVPATFSKKCVCGDVMVGDTVTGMRQFRSRGEGSYHTVQKDLSTSNDTHYPVLLELGRTPSAAV